MKSSSLYLRLILLMICGFPALISQHCDAANLPISHQSTGQKLPPTAKRQQIQPNEAGLIPILEYHVIRAGKSRTFRSADLFRHDLRRLYAENYRPISVAAYLDNKIDLPYGQSPVILTFDDSTATQFKYLPDGSADPNCAVGILQEFHRSHPDFPIHAVFFVVPRQGFGPAGQTARKLQALLAMGCEIGNHTSTHPVLHRLSDERVQHELAMCVADIRKMAPNAKVDTLALPYGVAARNRKLEISGKWNGIPYHNRAVFLAGANPAPAILSKHFDPVRIPRILALGVPDGLTYWLDRLKRKGGGRYISDGNPNVVTIPSRMLNQIDKTRLNGARLQTY